MGFEEIASVFLRLLCENGDQFWSQDKWFKNKTFLLKKNYMFEKTCLFLNSEITETYIQL